MPGQCLRVNVFPQPPQQRPRALDYQPWFDNQRRLRELIAEMEALSQEIADNDPRWNR